MSGFCEVVLVKDLRSLLPSLFSLISPQLAVLKSLSLSGTLIRLFWDSRISKVWRIHPPPSGSSPSLAGGLLPIMASQGPPSVLAHARDLSTKLNPVGWLISLPNLERKGRIQLGRARQSVALEGPGVFLDGCSSLCPRPSACGTHCFYTLRADAVSHSLGVPQPPSE